MGLVFSTDGGWIAVDDAGNYDAELQAEIDAAAQSSGVAQRDLAMDYRPTLTNTGYSFTPTIEDPKITIANLLDTSSQSAGTGRYVSDESATQDLMAAIQKAYAEGQVQLGPDPEPAAQSTGPKVGDRTQNDQGQIVIWDGTAWVLDTQTADTSVFDQSLGQAKTEAEQYLSEAITDLEGRGGGLPGDYHERLVKLSLEYTNGNLTADQVQAYVNSLGTAAVNGLNSIFKGDTNSLEGFLSEVHGLWNIGTGPAGLNRWTESIGYTTTTTLDEQATDITANLDKIAGGAQDVNGFIEGLLKGTMELGGTWAQTLDTVAQALFDNQKIWDTANDGAGYPGLVGRVDLNSPEDVKQWLHGIYAGFDGATKTRLVSAYPNKGPDLSSDYTVFAKAPDPSGTPIIGDGIITGDGITPSPIDGAGDFDPTRVDSPTGVPIPTTASTGIYDPFFEDAQRTFATVYDPFTMNQPGYNMPGIRSAYTSAGGPLSTQYSMQLPDLQVPGEVGLDPKYQTANEFLQSLTGGTGRILRGGDLYSRLQDISTALGSDPMQMGMDPRTELYQGQFGTAAQQRDAFLQPFLMATRGSPEARSALVNSVNQAAKQFEYQNPMGVPTAGGGRQGFLGWAMDNNLLGIKDMFNPNTMQEIERKRQLQQPSDLGQMGYMGGQGTGFGIDVWGDEG